MRARLAVGGGRQRLWWGGPAGLNGRPLTIRVHSVSTDFPSLLCTSRHAGALTFGITGFRVAAEQDIHIDHG
ncbi:hypothetical protein DF044_29730 [Burkholderia contaminans]|nr:hypothetical protein DF044_29730 [Burkholderia contaminans]